MALIILWQVYCHLSKLIILLKCQKTNFAIFTLYYPHMIEKVLFLDQIFEEIARDLHKFSDQGSLKQKNMFSEVALCVCLCICLLSS